MFKVLLLVAAIPVIFMGSTIVAAEAKVESLVGKTIRVTTDSTMARSMVTGVLSRLDSTTVYLRQLNDSNEVQVPLVHVDRLQIRGREHGNALLGAFIGAGVGAATMTVITQLDSDSHDFIDLSGFFILVGAGSGLVTGGIVGSQIKSGEWQTVPTDRLYMAGLSYQRTSVKLTFGLRF